MSAKATIPEISERLPREIKDILKPLKELVEVRSGRRPSAATQFPAELGTGLPAPLSAGATLAETIVCANKLNAQLAEVINAFNQLRSVLLS